MAITPITNAEIQAGKPTKQELFQKSKDNFDDLDSRVSDLESSVAAEKQLQFTILGEGYVGDGVVSYPIYSNTRITDVRLYVNEAGVSGSLDIDIEYKRGASPFASIFSVTPSVDFSAGDFASDNGTLSFTDLIPNDIVRINIDNVQSEMKDGLIIIFYEGFA